MQKSNLSTFKQYESNVSSYCKTFPVIFENAKNSYLYEKSGQEYIDFFAGAGALNYGHNNELMKNAVIDYLKSDGVLMSLDLHTEAKREFIDSFIGKILKPRSLDYKMQFTSPSGTSVVESAIKLARRHTNRQNIVAFTNAFHGMSGVSLSLTGNSHHRQSISYGQVTRIPYDGYLGKDFDSVMYFRKLLEDPGSGVDLPAAIILETVQGEGGLNTASIGWLKSISEIAQEFNILLIIDDIQAGCGRSGSFFSFERADITPDIVCLSKSIGGFGVPFSVLLFKPGLDTWNVGEDNGTFRGNNIAFVAAKVMIDNYWSNRDFELELHQKSNVISKFCNRMMSMYPSKVSKTCGLGFMQGITFFDPDDAKGIIQTCFNNRLIIESCGPMSETLKFMPALTISMEVLEKGLSRIEDSIHAYYQEVQSYDQMISPIELAS